MAEFKRSLYLTQIDRQNDFNEIFNLSKSLNTVIYDEEAPPGVFTQKIFDLLYDYFGHGAYVILIRKTHADILPDLTVYEIEDQYMDWIESYSFNKNCLAENDKHFFFVRDLVFGDYLLGSY